MKIVIPTYNRYQLNQQQALKYLPKELMKDTYIVVQEQQKDQYQVVADHYGCNLHTLPTGSKGIALARKQIAEWLKGQRYWVLDDDVRFAFYDFKNPTNGRKYSINSTPDYEIFKYYLDAVNKWMDEGLMFAALQDNTTPPKEKEVHPCSRTWLNVFYSEHLPVDEIDWGEQYEIMPEDFHVCLQLLKAGHSNAVIGHLRANPVSTTNAPGGCSEYRTLEKHNDGQQILGDLHPDVVTVVEKVQKTGPLGGLVKKSVRVQWQKAYKSSGKDIPDWKLP